MNVLKKIIVICFLTLLSNQLFAQLAVKSDFDTRDHQLHVKITNVSDYIIRFMSEEIFLEQRSCHVLIKSIDTNGETIKTLRNTQLFGDYYLFLQPNETFSKYLNIPECHAFEAKYEFLYDKLDMEDVTGTVHFQQNRWKIGRETIVFYSRFLYNGI
jgi:hypothetical protein